MISAGQNALDLTPPGAPSLTARKLPFATAWVCPKAEVGRGRAGRLLHIDQVMFERTFRVQNRKFA